MPTPGPIRRGRSSTQIGEGVIRRGRVRADQSRDDDRIAQLEASAAAQQIALELQLAAIADLQLGRVEQLRPQAVVDRHVGIARAFLGDPWRWQPLTLFEVLIRASLRG